VNVILKVRGLRNVFGSQVVHENLDLDLYQGEILGVVGGSGAGKSVLLRSVLGLHRFQAGSVKWFGKEMPATNSGISNQGEPRLGIMFQDGALFSSLTVLENVMLPLKEHSQISASFAHELALLKIRLVGLPDNAAGKYPDTLSGGMRKRAGIARALALDPQVLCLDEPTSGLDPIGAAEFDQLVLTLRRSLGLSVLMVTHDLDSLYATCDRVAVLADRHVVIADTPAVVSASPHPWVRACFDGPRARAVRAGPVHQLLSANAPALSNLTAPS